MSDLINSKTAIYLVILILFFVILILVATIGALLYVFTKGQKNLALGPVFDSKNEVEDVQNRASCFFHENSFSQGLCAICEKSLCENCVKANDKLIFCPEHYITFLNNTWLKLETIKTTPETPLEGIVLYSFKQDIWQKKQTPTYLVTHYTINVENDLIESYVTLFVRQQDLENLKEKFLSTKPLSH